MKIRNIVLALTALAIAGCKPPPGDFGSAKSRIENISQLDEAELKKYKDECHQYGAINDARVKWIETDCAEVDNRWLTHDMNQVGSRKAAPLMPKLH